MSGHRPRMNSAMLFNEVNIALEREPSTPRIAPLKLSFDMPELILDLTELPSQSSEFTRDDDDHSLTSKKESVFEKRWEQLKEEIRKRQSEQHVAKRTRFLSDFTHSQLRGNTILGHFRMKSEHETKHNIYSLFELTLEKMD